MELGVHVGHWQSDPVDVIPVAREAEALGYLSNGRLRLGLGTTGPGVSEGWHGAPFEDPLGRTREYVELVRTMLRRDEPVRFEGRHYRLPAERGTGAGLSLKLGVRPLRPDIPIYLGAMG